MSGLSDRPAPTAPRTIRDVLDVRRHPTVVRLDHLASDDRGWITSAYHRTREIRAHLESLERALASGSGTGAFLIGPYGSGKSHFLAYVVERIRAGEIAARGPEPVALSLLNYRGETPLEDIVCGVLGVETGPGDRRLAWSALADRHPRGLVLILDELSEFLRSKPDPPRFNEDARFLQFLGEWAAGGKLWVVAAMQEAIEHTGVLERGLYRKIKDRFPLRLLLGTSHVRDLVRDAVLVKKEGYDESVEGLAREIRSALADVAFDERTFRAVYPLHPATLELLDEVRDRFSAARGVVDFTVTRLAGDPARHVDPFLDRPFGDVLLPDVIVDHFQDLFEVQPEFLPLAERVFPWFRKRIPEIFPGDELRGLAGRLLKLLVLVHLAPDRPGLTAAEAAAWLLYRPSRLDPAKNRRVLERVLEKLRTEGRFVVREGEGYRLDLDDEGTAEVDRLLEREKAELAGRDEALFEELAPLFEKAMPAPFGLPRERWQPRDVRWHFHERRIAVYLGEETPPPPEEDVPALCVRLPWGGDDPAPGAFTLRPATIDPGPEVVELVAVERLRARRWPRAAAARLESLGRERLELLKARIRNAYLDARVSAPGSSPEPAPRVDPSLPLARWIDGYAEWMLRRTYPSFERFAPSHGPLPKEAFRSWARFASDPERREDQAGDLVKVVREAYLVPMGLLRRKGREYVSAPRLESHELVRLVAAMVEQRPEPRAVYERLRAPVYGLVADQTGLLLVFLALEGHLEILKEGRSYRELYETLPNPIHYDRIEPAEALDASELQELRRLVEGFGLRLPAQWTVPAQRHLAERLRETARDQIAILRGLLEKVESFRSDPGLAAEVEEVVEQWSVLERSEHPLKGLENFLHAIGSASRFVSRASSFAALPARLDRILAELRRYRHLLEHPVLASTRDEAAKLRLEALGEPPPLRNPEAVEEWIGRAEEVYRRYREDYRARHDAWWQERRDAPLLSWRPPPVARSRHLGLRADLAKIEELRSRAAALRCRGLVNLDFQPVCACGFDGRSSPFGEVLDELAVLRERVESELERFFAAEEIRSRVRTWSAEGLESGAGAAAYLEGRAPHPEVREVELLDRHLAGVELVAEIDPGSLADALGGRAWERRALVEAFGEWVERFGDRRLRFARAEEGAASPALWCVEQALRFGVSLPGALGAGELERACEELRAEWVGSPALSRLEELGLPGGAEERVVGWIVDGTIAPPPREAVSGLVRAALELSSPTTPASAGDLATLSEELYVQHHRMVRVAREPWLERLDALAATSLESPPPPLLDVLAERAEAGWVVFDALGAPLQGMLEREIAALFPAWRVGSKGFALAPGATTTDALYRELAAAGTRHPIEKVNAVDRLIHERFVAFDDLSRLAAAELGIACRRLAPALDADRPLLLFADHGFRIAPDGRSWTHGGGSTLERLVPLWLLVPERSRP